MKHLTIVAALATLGLVGCAPSSVVELRQQAQPVVFSVDQPYQRVYKDIHDELERCAAGGFLFSNTEVTGQLYPDLGEGDIAVKNSNMGDSSAFLSLTVSGDAEAAKVEAYSADVGQWKGSSEKIKDFVASGKAYCD